MKFTKVRLGMAAVFAFMLVLVMSPTPAQAANWAQAANGDFPANSSRAIGIPGGTLLEVAAPFTPGASATRAVTPINIPSPPGNYRHSVLLDRPDENRLQLRVTNEGSSLQSATLEAVCTSGAPGGTIVSGRDAADSSRPFMGLLLQTNGNTGIYRYNKDSGGNIVNSQPFGFSATGSASAGLTFSHGKLRSGAYKSGNPGCDARTGQIKMGASNGTICLDASGPADPAGVRLQTMTCGPSTNPAQQWTYTPSEQTIKALGKCMTVENNVDGNGTAVRLNTCIPGNPAQQWLHNPVVDILPGLGDQLKFRNTNECLDVPDGNTSPGQQLQTWACRTSSDGQNTQDAQRWIVPLD